MIQQAKNQRDKEILETRNHLEANNFQVGQVVMKRRESFERENKRDSKWAGPYVITRDFGNRGYEIKGPNNKLYRYNKMDLRIMENTDPEIWEEVEQEEMLDTENDISKELLYVNLL